MNLERLEDYVKPTIALIVGLWLAVMCGYMVGNGEGKFAMVMVVGIVVLAFVIKLQERVWMLIFFAGMLSGKVSVLPLPFTVAQIGIFIAFVMFLLLKALKVIRVKPKGGLPEVIMMVLLFYIAVTYIRNPVGVDALGSDRVGGRPYADIFVACLGFWVLARAIVTPRQTWFVIWLSAIGAGIHTALNLIAYRFPSTIGPISNLYSGIEAAENQEWSPIPDERTRLTYLSGFGSSLMVAACSLWRPLTFLNPLHIFRFLIFVSSIVMTLMSGFRSNLFGLFEMFLVGSYFRGGISDVMRTAGIGTASLAILILLQGNVVDLPLPAQRALSFLPGKWEYAAKSEAEGSTEWRVTMWQQMLSGNKYIENKWFGDGFGFTRYQLSIMNANAQSRTTEDQQENLMISGGVHSGPVSSIRYIGYIGLALLLIFMVFLGIRGVRLVKRARGTPFFPLALSTGILTVIWPFNFVVIFGAPENDIPAAILTAGFQLMLQNSLDAYFAGQKETTVETIQPPKVRQLHEFATAAR